MRSRVKSMSGWLLRCLDKMYWIPILIGFQVEFDILGFRISISDTAEKWPTWQRNQTVQRVHKKIRFYARTGQGLGRAQTGFKGRYALGLSTIINAYSHRFITFIYHVVYLLITAKITWRDWFVNFILSLKGEHINLFQFQMKPMQCAYPDIY